jgi:hypothetical protein
MKTDPATGAKEVPLEKYRENLPAIVGALRDIGCKVVWVRTTPVDDQTHNSRCAAFHRFGRDVAAYNAAADEIMLAAGVPIIDLHGFTSAMEGEIFCDHVHFPEPVQRLQAAFIAGSLLASWFVVTP